MKGSRRAYVSQLSVHLLQILILSQTASPVQSSVLLHGPPIVGSAKHISNFTEETFAAAAEN